MEIQVEHKLSDEDWNSLKPLFQKTLGKYWRTREEKDRITLDGILWKLKTGTPWRKLPKRYGNWGTVYQRYHRWNDLGLWKKILATLSQNSQDQSR